MKESIFRIYEKEDIKLEHRNIEGCLYYSDFIVLLDGFNGKERCPSIFIGWTDAKSNPLINVMGAVELGLSGTIYKGISREASYRVLKSALNFHGNYDGLSSIIDEYLLTK